LKRHDYAAHGYIAEYDKIYYNRQYHDIHGPIQFEIMLNRNCAVLHEASIQLPVFECLKLQRSCNVIITHYSTVLCAFQPNNSPHFNISIQMLTHWVSNVIITL
jgi:hypothetical protein